MGMYALLRSGESCAERLRFPCTVGNVGSSSVVIEGDTIIVLLIEYTPDYNSSTIVRICNPYLVLCFLLRLYEDEPK